MKKFLIFFLMLLPLAIASCGGDDKDEPQTTANDPEGTILINLQNIFTGDYWHGYEGGIEDMNNIYGCCFGMNQLNNLQAASTDEGYSNGGVEEAEICSLGKVKNLSDIKSIPESGWAYQSAAVPGYGYIYRLRYLWSTKVTYARIYVVDYIKNTSGGIIGATVKYQQNWKPE